MDMNELQQKITDAALHSLRVDALKQFGALAPDQLQSAIDHFSAILNLTGLPGVPTEDDLPRSFMWLAILVIFDAAGDVKDNQDWENQKQTPK